jgi:hypothetical protein
MEQNPSETNNHHVVKKFASFMELDISLPASQYPVSSSCPELEECSLKSNILFLFSQKPQQA